MDQITKERRSWNMSRIRSKDTKPETVARKYLYSKGIRYRLHAKLPGKPDIAMKRRKTVVFVNGCFWHGHNGCRYFRWPQTKEDYWRDKISGNMERDARNYATLKKAGWRVLIIWECDIKRSREDTLRQLYADITE